MTLNEELLLALQAALLDRVTPNLRAVTVDWTDGIQGELIFDGELGDEDVDAAADIETALQERFPAHTVQLIAVRVDAHRQLAPHFRRAWAFKRREPDQ